MRVAVTGLGVCTALGDDPHAVVSAIHGGRSALRRPDGPRGELPIDGLAEVDVDVRPFLRRRKDKKLLPRAAELAIPAARRALGDLELDGIGCFLGVGREPPENETARAILASATDGELDPVKLGQDGLALYPPLASLRTLPNLVLAHVAIQLGLTGEGASVAGEGAVGLVAVVRACQAIDAGRCRVALAGGADSLCHGALARDHVRAGRSYGVGEGAAWLRLEDPAHARARGATVLAEIIEVEARIGRVGTSAVEHRAALGSCGAADGALALALSLCSTSAGRVALRDPSSQSAAIRWQPPPESPP